MFELQSQLLFKLLKRNSPARKSHITQITIIIFFVYTHIDKEQHIPPPPEHTILRISLTNQPFPNQWSQGEAHTRQGAPPSLHAHCQINTFPGMFTLYQATLNAFEQK